MDQTATLGPVLVTGAGGFIGSQVMRQLGRSTPLAVIAATRDGRDGSRLLDLRDHGSLPNALAGVGAVVHCAVGNRAVTVDGTRALLDAARAAGVRRFIHISSVAVYGAATGDITEQTPMRPGRTGYPAWKAAAEQACLAQQGMEVVRLRPAIVYGPGSALWVARLAERIRSGRWGVFGAAGEGTCNLVHVDDVADAVRLALLQPGIGGSAFNLNGSEPMTWNGWFSRMAEALGAPRLRSIPPAALHARSVAALPVKAWARVRPGFASDWLLGAPARSELRLFARKATYIASAARDRLGWHPQTSVADGLEGCLQWLRDKQ